VTTELYFEDFVPGAVFDLGTRSLSDAEIVAFAEQWDPQAFHLGGADVLIASGWQTACVWMRMYVDAVLSRAAMFTAPGVEQLRWLRPVKAGMPLRGRATIVDRWPSESTAGRGTLQLRGELLAADEQLVMTMLARGHARLREVNDG
jgi:acyl dehydratase